MSSTHNHCFSHHHYQALCYQIFFVNNTKIFVTSSVLKLQKWFLHQNGVESNQKSKSDMYKLLGGVWRCVSYQKVCSRWLLAWYHHLAWLDIVANCAMDSFHDCSLLWSFRTMSQRHYEILWSIVDSSIHQPRILPSRLTISPMAMFSSSLVSYTWLRTSNIWN